jgi:hypothetical protein
MVAKHFISSDEKKNIKKKSHQHSRIIIQMECKTCGTNI